MAGNRAMLKKISVRHLLLCAFILAGLIPFLVFSLLGFKTASRQLKLSTVRHLESVRDMKAAQIRRFFQERVADSGILAADPLIAAGVEKMAAIFSGAGDRVFTFFSTSSADGFSAPPEYVKVHEPLFRRLADWARVHHYYDILLISADTGRVVFSLKKEADFGGRVQTLSGSLFSAWQQALISQRTVLTDTCAYGPSAGRPAQFIVTPVKKKQETAGVLAVQISNDAVARIMAGRSGMAAGCEAYLIGKDKRMRSDSFMAPHTHSMKASFQGSVKNNGVDTAPADRALRGISGSGSFRNYLGRQVISAFAPVGIADLNWAILAEMEEHAIDAAVSRALRPRLIPLFLLSIFLIAGFALGTAHVINREISGVTGQIEAMIRRVLAGNLSARGNVSSGGRDFAGVIFRVNQLADTLQQEVAEKNRLEQQAYYSRRLHSIGTLAAGIAHDMNNLFSSLRVLVEVVKQHADSDPELQKMAADISQAVQQGAGLVNQILTFSSPGSVARGPVSFTKVVKGCAGLLNTVAHKNIRLNADICSGDLMVRGSESQLQQVVTNLVINGFEAMKETGGELYLQLRPVLLKKNEKGMHAAGEYSELRVRDQGSGIPCDMRQRIFEPFYSTRPASESSGLGLSVVKGIVLSFKGFIELDCNSGSGAEFRVYLPVCK